MIKRGWVIAAWLMVFITASLVAACGGGSSTSTSGGSSVLAGIPSAPAGVTATATSPSQININWTLDPSATNYHIYRSTAPNVAITPANQLAVAASGPYSNTGLPAAATYYYKVTEVNANGESAGSAEVSATTLAAAPVLLGGAIQGNSLALTTAVTTFAGTAGVTGSTDGTSTYASFNFPEAVTTDGTNLYIADAGNSVIRKIVIATGAVTTLAGTAGVTGATDGTGAAASFNSPQGITTDGTNLYVVDTNNFTIRKINITTGVVTTLAGTAGVTGATDGTGTAASFQYPQGITTDGTNLYVADLGNQTIRKIVISTGVVTTLAGTAGVAGYADDTGTAALFFGPFDITTDGTNLYVADYNNYVIRKIVIATGAVTTLAGTAGIWGSAGGTGGPVDGTGAAASFCYPKGITTDGINLYVTDAGSQTIRKIVIATGAVTTLAGSFVFDVTGMPYSPGIGGSADGVGTAASFNNPLGITTDGASLYIADSANSTIRKMQ